MGKIIATIILGIILFGAVYYYLGDTIGIQNPVTGIIKPIVRIKPEQLGGSLYEPTSFPVLARQESKKKDLPVAISGHLTAMEQVELPSQVAGQILFVGEEVPEGVAQAAGVGGFMAEPYYYTSMFMGDRKLTLLYRRYYEGQTISQEKVLLVVDYAKALGMVLEKKAKVLASKADRDAAKKTADETQNRYERAKLLRQQGSIAEEELAEKRLGMEAKFFEHLNKIQQVSVAEQDQLQAEIILQQHKIRNKLGYDRTFIRSILKSRGSSVKELEPVMLLQAIDRLLAEASIESQYLDRVAGKQTATIEPSQEEAPTRPLNGHRGNVTCVTVSKDRANPLILSGSEDRTVCVWNRYSSSPQRVLHHKDIVQSIACTSNGAEKDLCLSGCSDGTIYLWNLSDETATPLKVFNNGEGRSESITSLAFSPDGKFFASGSADGTIRVWATNEGNDAKLLYPFESKYGVDDPHRGAITALNFLPQSVLVSASRDNTIRVWNLQEKGASLRYEPIKGRDGKVGQLGVSKDGLGMIFDQGRTLQLLTVEKGEPITTLTSPGSSTPFETLAIFSPDGTLMLTAGASEGRLQLWRAPTVNDRGYEVRQFISQERWPASCAAFSPSAGEGGELSFAVSASKHKLYLWPVPSKEEVKNHRIENVPLRLISQSLDTSTRMQRIGFELANTNRRLLPGRPVTIVID